MYTYAVWRSHKLDMKPSWMQSGRTCNDPAQQDLRLNGYTIKNRHQAPVGQFWLVYRFWVKQAEATWERFLYNHADLLPICKESNCLHRWPSWPRFRGPNPPIPPAASPWCGCLEVRWWIVFLQRRGFPTKSAGSLCSSRGPPGESPGDGTCRPSQTVRYWCTVQRTAEKHTSHRQRPRCWSSSSSDSTSFQHTDLNSITASGFDRRTQIYDKVFLKV